MMPRAAHKTNSAALMADIMKFRGIQGCSILRVLSE
jgi:hypothetical protein